MRRLRQLVQLVVLALFLGLVWTTTWPLRAPVSPALFLRLDPLAALTVLLSPERPAAWLALFWPALALTALTILLGRFFCGWLCPLGSLLDLTDRLFGRVKARPLPGAWRYGLLAVTLGAALFGAQFLLLLDPLCLFTRATATALHPGLHTAYNGWLSATQRLWEELGWRLDPAPAQLFRLNLLAAGLLLGVVALGRWAPRHWCRSLCPLGALLSMLGRFGLWRRVVADDCPACGACARSCHFGAITPEEPSRTRQADCVQCYDCVDACGPGDTRLTLAWPAPAVDTGTDLGRRQFLGLAGVGAAYGLLTVAGLDRRAWHDRLIRPPGAIVRDEQGQVLRLMTEAEFRDKCLRCGQCLKACPTGGLQPAVGEAGLDGFYTPILVPRAGWCEQSCEACGKVCPSGALIPFTAAEKVNISIGLATITRDKCLAWREGDQYAQCVVCKEFCSYGAVELHRVGGQDRPYVRDYKCVGCGICESACPVKPEAAIVVHRRGTPDDL